MRQRPPLSVAQHRRRMALYGAAALVLLLAIALSWRYTPLHAYADPRLLAAELGALQNIWWTPLLIVAIYITANALLFPNTILNVATILGLGTAMGLPCALLGSLSASVVFYFVGLRYGKEKLRRLESARLDRLSEVMRDGGILGVVMVRLVPIAPHTVVNLAAGAMHVRLMPFVVGTFLGMLPGNLLVTAFGAQLRALMRHPQPSQVVLLCAILLLAVAGVWWTGKRVGDLRGAQHSRPA